MYRLQNPLIITHLLSPDNPEKNRDNCEYEEKMDDPAGNVENTKTQNPEDEK